MKYGYVHGAFSLYWKHVKFVNTKSLLIQLLNLNHLKF